MRKPSRKTIIDKLDKLAKKACMIRDDNTCQMCGCREIAKLQCSHVERRELYNLRWALPNLKILCSGCHLKWHDSPLRAAEWFNAKFPDRKNWINELLKKPLKTWRDSDLKEIEQMLLQKIHELENE